jgi:hypothetical protein
MLNGLLLGQFSGAKITVPNKQNALVQATMRQIQRQNRAYQLLADER